MSEFKQYRRKLISEMRPYVEGEHLGANVSISQADLDGESPKIGDMIARSPKDHNDQWLVAKDYFKDNLEPVGKKDGLTYGLAIEALRLGKCIARKGWNGKDMFVFYQIPSDIPLNIVPKMQSVPKSVKDLMINRNQGLSYGNGMIIVKPDGTADSWVASSSDTFAEDWMIV